jgi:hypothetical protein
LQRDSEAGRAVHVYIVSQNGDVGRWVLYECAQDGLFNKRIIWRGGRDPPTDYNKFKVWRGSKIINSRSVPDGVLTAATGWWQFSGKRG